MNILFFDYWDKGLPVFKNILPFFQDKKIDQKSMVHLDSYFRKEYSEYKKDGDIDVYDISFFKEKNIESIIESLAPSIIIITNIKLYERLICIVANKKKIPVYYFLHGNIGPIFAAPERKHNWIQKSGEIVSKITSNLSLVAKYVKVYQLLYYPEYVVYNTAGSRISRLGKFMVFAFNKLKNRFYDFEYIEFPEDFFIDFAVVYSDADVKFLTGIHADIRQYFLKANLEFVKNMDSYKGLFKEKQQILIVDDGFSAYNLYDLNADKLSGIYNTITEKFNAHPVFGKYEVALKIKAQELTRFEDLNLKCRILRNENIYQCIQESAIVIGTHSTALKYAIIELKPLILLKWPEFVQVPDVYFQHGIGNAWRDSTAFPNMDIDKEAYQDYIETYNLNGKRDSVIVE